ncbi:unnamed protein product [Brassicogethes aeneus]|uniref:ceramide glucosyltransferase n=1 Tax=Brassicogethes aeneus TaxID=1431903 RepID=A0A9P0FMS1_BRAAE|nr:unnamed protein product [Brassicogethes aeneus]
MDANLINIFYTDKDWIVTTNQNGKTKITARNENELHEETKNFIEIEDKKPETTRENYVFMKTKIARLFISDIHCAVKSDDYFKFKNVLFAGLELFGTVTSAYVHGDYNCVVLDDGTSNIICLFKKYIADEAKIHCDKKLQNFYSALKNDNTDSLILKVAIMMKKNTRDVLSKVPRLTEINIGDTVRIVGKLSEYNNKKYVFINRFNLDNSNQGLEDNLKQLLDLKYRLHKIQAIVSDVPPPGVSILKPLMGVDPNLSSNLETFFTMNYPSYELLFSVEDKKDPAIEIVNTLKEKYPKVDATIYTGGSTVGVNPKINNINTAYEASNYDLILISDSGIRMKEDTLLDMVNHLSDRTGIVHQMPFTCDRNGFAATLEKIYFGTAQSRIYLAADLLGTNCHTGMSTLMRKQVLEQQGGLKKFGCYLAEDYFIAQCFLDNGWRLAISSHPALQNSGTCDVHSFQERLLRWAKLRVAMVPLLILLEPLSECMVIGFFAAWSTSYLFKFEPLVFYLVHILLWFMCDWILLSIVQNGSLPFNKFDFIIGWLFRECSGPYLFLLAFMNPAIRWRNRMFKLAWGGLAQEINPRIKC